MSEPEKASPAPVPEGWKLVPAEPTDDMLIATRLVLADRGQPFVWGSDAAEIYRAMLAAAPAPDDAASPAPVPVASEPVAWQWRYSYDQGLWSEWGSRRDDASELLASGVILGEQSRALYASPQPTFNDGVEAERIADHIAAEVCGNLRVSARLSENELLHLHGEVQEAAIRALKEPR